MQPKALADLKVIELANFITGPYCGKLLADLGADVIKVEPPTGDTSREAGPFRDDEPHPERSGLFLYLNTSKRGVSMDVTTAEGRDAFTKLVEDADVVVENYPPGWLEGHGLGYVNLQKANPRLIMTSITPFGQTGPYSGYQATDLVSIHMGGLGYGIPGKVEDLKLQPLKAAGRQADFLTGLAAGVATLHAAFAREQDGRGMHVDVSAMDAVACVVFFHVASYEAEGKPPGRTGGGLGTGGLSVVVPCQDGYYYLSIFEDRQWHSWLELMGNPPWAQSELYRSRAGRFEHWKDLQPYVAEWSKQFTKQEIYRIAQAKRVPVTPIHMIDEALNSNQLAVRDYFAAVDHPVAGPITIPGAPYKLAETPWRIARPAPTLGQHNEEVLCRQLGYSPESLAALRGAGPAQSLDPARNPDEASSPGVSGLEAATKDRRSVESAVKVKLQDQPGSPSALAGIRIADFSWVYAGPICTKYLAMMGAEVIKIETRRRPDLFRVSGAPIGPDGRPLINQGRFFNAVNHSKLSCTLDLTKPEAVAIARAIIRISDVVVENFAFGFMERVGLGYSTLREINPRIIMLSSSGLGRTGPERETVAYGSNLHAYSGLVGLIGYEGGPPRGIGSTWSDPLTGVTATFAILAALHHRRQTGQGQLIDLSMTEATLAPLPEAVLDYAMNGRVRGTSGNRDDNFAPHNCYPCKGDDKWVAIAVVNDAQWRALCLAIGRPQLANDERFAGARRRWLNQTELDPIIAGWTRHHSAYEAMAILQAAGIPAGPSLNAQELVDDPQMRARGVYIPIDHAETGKRLGYTLPWKMEPSPTLTVTPSPLLGEHNDYVALELLGMAPEEVQGLKDEGVIY